MSQLCKPLHLARIWSGKKGGGEWQNEIRTTKR